MKILVIRLSAMGDVAMTVPALKALTETYPSLRITMLTKGAFEPIFEPLKNVTVFNAKVTGKHKGVRGLWKLYSELKVFGFIGVADLHNVLRSNILKQFFRLQKIPFVQIDKGRSEKHALTSQTNKVFKQLRTTHDRYADVFRELGYPIDLENVSCLPKQPLSENIRVMLGSNPKKWIGVAPFAAYPGKQYPLKLMEQVVARLNETDRYKICLFGGGKEEFNQLKAWANSYDNCVNFVGNLNFAEELTLISNLDLMLSMDSGNAHLAANYGIPVVSLWGVTHPFAGFYPFRQHGHHALLADRSQFPGIPTSIYGNRLPGGYENAIATITPDRIMDKLFEILQDENNPG